jgi:hypothetical protein
LQILVGHAEIAVTQVVANRQLMLAQFSQHRSDSMPEQEPRAEDIPPAEERVREAQANLADAEVQVRLIESVTDKRAVRDPAIPFKG